MRVRRFTGRPRDDSRRAAEHARSGARRSFALGSVGRSVGRFEPLAVLGISLRLRFRYSEWTGEPSLLRRLRVVVRCGDCATLH